MTVMGALEAIQPNFVRRPSAGGRYAVLAAGLAAVLLAAGGVVFASTAPDGIEQLAIQTGISGHAHALISTPFKSTRLRGWAPDGCRRARAGGPGAGRRRLRADRPEAVGRGASRHVGSMEPRCERAPPARSASQDCGSAGVSDRTGHRASRISLVGRSHVCHVVRSRPPGTPAPGWRAGTRRSRSAIYCRVRRSQLAGGRPRARRRAGNEELSLCAGSTPVGIYYTSPGVTPWI